MGTASIQGLPLAALEGPAMDCSALASPRMDKQLLLRSMRKEPRDMHPPLHRMSILKSNLGDGGGLEWVCEPEPGELDATARPGGMVLGGDRTRIQDGAHLGSANSLEHLEATQCCDLPRPKDIDASAFL